MKTLGPISDPIVERKSRSKKNEEEERVKICKSCKTYNELTAKECIACGEVFVVPIKTEKMSLIADDGVSLIGEKRQLIQEVKEVKFYNYQSKSGNNCRVIEYVPKGFDFSYNAGNIKEYFVIGNPYAEQRYNFRRSQFENAEMFGEKLKYIQYEMDGKYPKVKRLEFKQEE